jgi:hypothetical protein
MDFERTYDVIVAGGGVAGVAAALEAARAGVRTALVEKTVLLGGLATIGIIQIYLPLCDGHGRQVIHGISEELLQLSLKYGPGDVSSAWKAGMGGRYMTHFSPAAFVLAIDEALEAAGVQIWLDTLACKPIMEDNRAVGLEVENKSGRGKLQTACLIDATGDADLLYRAGADCADGLNWLSYWGHLFSLPELRKAIEAGNGKRIHEILLFTLGADNAGRGQPMEAPRFRGIDGEEVTRFVLAGRKLLRERLEQDHASGHGLERHNHFPELLPAMAQFRTTRRIIGLENLSSGQNNVRFETSIGLTGDWRKAGPVWEIPFGTLVPRRVRGMLAAGRCIAAEEDAWEVLRVIPPAALTGQIAGMAAWIALEQRTTPEQLGAEVIQAELRKRGMPFHIEQ